MILLAGLVAGAVVAGVAWAATAPTLRSPSLARPNHRGAAVPTGGGLVLVLAVLAVEAAAGVAEAAGVELAVDAIAGRRLVVLAALGFGLLGFVDDVLGVGESGGFRGHLGAIVRGRLTSGGIKMLGGAALALVIMAALQPGSVGRILADGALVALCANLANLLDRAPGRVTKASVVAAAVLLAAAGLDEALLGVALVLGAGLGLLLPDLREQVMLGDAGANVLGAALGIGVVLTCAPATRTGVLVGVAAMNLASELVSFSRVIDRVPPLRWVDRLGRS